MLIFSPVLAGNIFLTAKIAKTTGLSSGGTLTKVLADLEESGFINSYARLEAWRIFVK